MYKYYMCYFPAYKNKSATTIADRNCFAKTRLNFEKKIRD